MRGNSHARCGAGEKPEEIECGLRPHSNTKGLPIAIIPGCYLKRMERIPVSSQPQYSLHRHHPCPGTADHCRTRGDSCHHDTKRQDRAPIHRIETAAAAKGGSLMFHRLLQLLFPPRCVLCKAFLTADETDLCHDCRIHTQEFSKSNFSFSFLAGWTAVW